MDTKFIAAYNEYKRITPVLNDDQAKRVRELITTMIDEAKADHLLTIKSKGMSDKAHCSCGWKSDGFWDGVEYARGEWQDHVYHDIVDDKLLCDT